MAVAIGSSVAVDGARGQGSDFAGQRAELDRTAWSQERLAQEHEAAFIALWDSLRTQPRARPALAAFAFDELTIGSPTEDARHDWDIVEARFGEPTRALDREQWSTLLRLWEKEGLFLEQSEWHHERFYPPEDGSAARSLIDVALHVSDRAVDRRLVVSGLLAVTWSARRDAAGHFVPAVIDASGLTLIERPGVPAFAEAAVLEAGTLLSPLISADLDDDGLDDLVAAGSNLLYRNRDGRFEPEPLLAYPPRGGNVEVALLADFTGDADPDLIVGGPEQFLGFYDGDRGFPLPGRAISTHMLRHPKAMSAGDIDADGDLDVWVGQYKIPYNQGQMPTPYYDANDGFIAYLLRNDGDGSFRDVTADAGLEAKRQRRTYNGSLADLDGDGDTDLLVVSDFAGIDLYHNDGTGRFSDVTSEIIGETATFGMSHTFGDYDADGRIDLYVIGMSSHTARRLDYLGLGRDDYPVHNRMRTAMSFGNRLYLGTDDGGFRVAPNTDRVARTGWSWGVASSDFDNDGDDDIYISNGHISGDSARDYCTTFWTHDVYTGDSDPDPVLARFFDRAIDSWYGAGNSWNGFEHNQLYLSDAGRAFTEIGYLMGVAFEFDARTVLDLDVDADGRMDLLVSEWSRAHERERVHVMRNQWPTRNNWLGIRLRGAPGISPIGARITLRSTRGERTRWVYTGESFDAQRSSTRIFGLGGVDQVEAVQVRWPNGHLTTLTGPEINRYHQITPQSRDHDERP